MKRYLKENLTIPNALSVFRIVLIYPMVRFLLQQNFLVAGIFLLLSAISDLLDGFIARKFNQITQLGKILDPIADKLTLIAVVVCINILYPDILLFVLPMFIKEILMLCGGALLLNFKLRPPAAKWYGKTSTVVFYASIITLVVLKAAWGYTNRALTITLLAVTTVLMLFSLVMYSMLFVRMIRQKIRDDKQQSLQKEETRPESPSEET